MLLPLVDAFLDGTCFLLALKRYIDGCEETVQSDTCDVKSMPKLWMAALILCLGIGSEFAV